MLLIGPLARPVSHLIGNGLIAIFDNIGYNLPIFKSCERDE
jgi:hypothetical protein